jgi:hypothetical protein
MNNRHTKLKSYDIAYSSFLICGVVVLLTAITSLIPMSTGTAGSIGFLILIPLSIISAIALLVGLLYAIRLRQHMPLTVLAILSVLFVVEVISEFGPSLFYNSVNWIYGSIAIFMPLWWFFIKRKDYAA